MLLGEYTNIITYSSEHPGSRKCEDPQNKKYSDQLIYSLNKNSVNLYNSNHCHLKSSPSKAWVTADWRLRPICAALGYLGELVKTKETFHLGMSQVMEVILAMHM